MPLLQYPSQERQDRISARIFLVHPIAERIFGKLFPPIRLDDLEQVGLIALIIACDKYKPNLEVTFEMYVRYSIRNAILDEVRRQISRHEYSLGEPDYPEPETEVRCDVDLRRALESLPPRERRLIELRLEGRTHAEAGQELGLTARLAGKLEARAIEALRARMNPPAMAKAA
jgi:RNA polymerase sigma factor (sigma-70 family)